MFIPQELRACPAPTLVLTWCCSLPPPSCARGPAPWATFALLPSHAQGFLPLQLSRKELGNQCHGFRDRQQPSVLPSQRPWQVLPQRRVPNDHVRPLQQGGWQRLGVRGTSRSCPLITPSSGAELWIRSNEAQLCPASLRRWVCGPHSASFFVFPNPVSGAGRPSSSNLPYQGHCLYISSSLSQGSHGAKLTFNLNAIKPTNQSIISISQYRQLTRRKRKMLPRKAHLEWTFAVLSHPPFSPFLLVGEPQSPP